VSVYHSKRSKIERALGRLRAARATGGTISLDPADADVCIQALESHLRALDETPRELDGLEALQTAKPRERLAPYARARGVELDADERRAKRPDALVVATYLAALEHGTLVEPMSSALLRGERAHRAWRREPGESVPVFALRATAQRWGFESAEACRVHLYRLKRKIASDRTGWRAKIDPTFPLPSSPDWRAKKPER
jgi:hypothetical protein